MCSLQGLGIQVILMVTVVGQMLLTPTTASLTPNTASKYPRGAYAEPVQFQAERTFCPRNGMLTFYNSPALLTPMCVPAPGPVRCHLQTMVSGRRPRGSYCRNKGYLSGWTKIPQEGVFYIKCCSSSDYTYSDATCREGTRTEQNTHSNLPPYYFPVGATPLPGGAGFRVRYCVFVRRRH
ncbi:uncharacterized protein LOC144621911 [Crassostrea virginica]